MSHTELVRILADCESGFMGPEKLRGLLRILPSEEELDKLRQFDGDRRLLGDAEQFCLALLELPRYDIQIIAGKLR